MRFVLPALLAVATALTVAVTTHADSPIPTPGLPTFVQRPAVRPVPAPRFELVDENGQSLSAFSAPDGRRYVLGALGGRYRVHVVNPTPSRIEAVLSVDGLDAIDGKPASTGKRGYVIPAFGDVIVEGWRTSLDTVAAFRFSSLRDSYASRTGQDQNVGVIGVAVFREQPPPPIAWRAMPRAAGGVGTPAPSAASKGEGDSGIGTRFGETHDSRVVETSFVRQTASPSQVTELRYDDRQGLLARGIALPPQDGGRWADLQRRDGAQPFAESRFAQPPR